MKNLEIEEYMLLYLKEQENIECDRVSVIETIQGDSYIVLINRDVNRAMLIDKNHFQRWLNLNNLI